MSFDIFWEKLDNEMAKKVQDILTNHFRNSANKPSFIGDIVISDFHFGTLPPSIEINNITDPFPEFYLPDNSIVDLDTNNNNNNNNNNNSNNNNNNNNSNNNNNNGSGSGSGSGSGNGNGGIGLSRMNSANSTASGLSNSYGIGGIGGIGTTSTNSIGFSSSIIDDYHNSEYLYYQQRLLREQQQHHLPYNHHLLHSTSPPSLLPSLLLPHHHLGENIIDNFDNVDSFESMMIPEEVEEVSSIKKHDTDAQLHISIDYKGDMRMIITTELYMNYPSMMFMSLPIRLTITGFEFSATAVIAYLKRRINFCFLEPKNPEESLLKEVHIESEVGDKEKQVLKNIGKLERFIVDQLRKFIDEELIFPSYHSIELE
ncbi:hypothetical protein Glove_431g28 [Diversispora epigaea]|uniref:Mitochondrial distribution and morphology protein 12 n=1 Tax=Diversispora epigaea TaxID=1348612 RepID=A0A397GYC2_9GLOM|nr:hypothetical protein Glove_431g28 [Diversispora epigaea]